VELLLTKGADVNAQGGRYSNALQAALFGGNSMIRDLLLAKGARETDVTVVTAVIRQKNL
jgi:hypothetical protein